MKKNGHISLIIIMLSLALFCSYHVYYYCIDEDSGELVESYYEKKEEKIVASKMNTTNEEKEEYLGILKIPKINLEKGFYPINSKNNVVSKNVTILKESTMPSKNGSIIYLVAHSGDGYLAFFKDLNKLELDDTIMIDINNTSYHYIINDIYEVEKNGKINVSHNIHENYLVLSTCNGNKQLVITSKLIDK